MMGPAHPKLLIFRIIDAHTRIWRKSIRWPLLTAISGNVLLTLLIVGLGIYLFISTAEQRSWQARQAENAREASTLIQTYLESRLSQLLLVSLPDIGKIDGESQALNSFIQRDPSWLEIVRLNSQGETLAGGYADQPMLQNMFTTRQAQWFRQAKSGATYVSNLGVSANDTSYLVIAVPASDGGVVAGRLRMDGLWDTVANIHFGSTGIAYIISYEDGRIIAYPDRQVVLKNMYASRSQVFQAIKTQPGSDWNGSFQNFQGALVQTHALLIPNSQWVIVTEVATREVRQTRTLALRISSAGMILLWLLITFTMNKRLGQLVLQPMEILREGADRIGQGDLGHRIPNDREDEIGRVTGQFNEMACQLAEREELLVKARDKALIDSQFKTDLLARVSHDLRQPLGVILGFSEMIQAGIFGPTTDGQQKAAGDIITSTRHLSQMVSDLLDSARLESHNLHLRIDNFSPALLLRQSCSQLGLLADQKGLALITELDPQLPETLRGDANRLQQIVNNLAGNAIKFTQQGSIRIRTYPLDEKQWALSVSDTGAGIPADALAYIFEPFRQVNDPATRDKGGVGLGLSIVQQLVTLMGGRIQVESRVGAGSTFFVFLPFEPDLKQGE